MPRKGALERGMRYPINQPINQPTSLLARIAQRRHYRSRINTEMRSTRCIRGHSAYKNLTETLIPAPIEAPKAEKPVFPPLMTDTPQP